MITTHTTERANPVARTPRRPGRVRARQLAQLEGELNSLRIDPPARFHCHRNARTSLRLGSDEVRHGKCTMSTRRQQEVLSVTRFQHLRETNILLWQLVLLLKLQAVHLLADPFEEL